MGAESLTHLKKLASNVPNVDGTDGNMEAGKDDDDDDVPDLVENFDEASKNEAKEHPGNWIKDQKPLTSSEYPRTRGCHCVMLRPQK